MGGRITGVGSTLAGLEKAKGLATRAARRTQAKYGDIIAETAQKMAPRKTGRLERAIRHERVRVGQGNTRISLVGVDVDEVPYAGFMHEGWEGHPSYKLGPESLRKAQAVGEVVGRKYLQRALDRHADDYLRDMDRAVSGALK